MRCGRTSLPVRPDPADATSPTTRRTSRYNLQHYITYIIITYEIRDVNRHSLNVDEQTSADRALLRPMRLSFVARPTRREGGTRLTDITYSPLCVVRESKIEFKLINKLIFCVRVSIDEFANCDFLRRLASYDVIETSRNIIRARAVKPDRLITGRRSCNVGRFCDKNVQLYVNVE